LCDRYTAGIRWSGFDRLTRRDYLIGMKLHRPFIKLPFRFDAARLKQEIDAFPADAWARHPNNIPGNSALRLITVGGTENDDVAGAMAPTQNLLNSEYLQQVLGHFGVVWSRSRLMRLGPGSTVPEHTDINYHWFHRVRLHIPIVTTPDVKFFCDDQVVHMAPGEAWIFDNWRMHKVENNSDIERVHLVADTTGNGRFWDMAHAAAEGPLPEQTVGYRPGHRVTLATERFNIYRVMPPSEVDELLSDLVAETVSTRPGAEGELQLRQFARLTYAFRQDWRQLWSLFADGDRGIPHYRKRLEMLMQQVQGLGDELRVGSNHMAAARVVGQRIGAYAVNDTVRPMGGAPSAIPTQAGQVEAPSSAPVTQPRPVMRTPDFDRPVIIVAAPRSGSTALFETLQVTPQFMSVGGEAHWLVEGFKALVPGGSAGVDSNRLTDRQMSPQLAVAMQARLTEKLRDGAGKPFANEDSVRLLEKTPKNALRIPFFNALFPDARFVFLWRQPEENISSIIDAWRAGGWITYPKLQGWDGPPWSLLLPPGWQSLKGRPLAEIAAYQWSETNRIIMDDLEALPAERRHVVRYDDFVANPGAAIQGIASFAAIDFDPALTERTAGDLPNSRYTLEAPRPDKWRKNAAEIEPLIPGLEAMRQRLQAFR